MTPLRKNKPVVLCLTALGCWAGLTLLFMVKAGAFKTEHHPLQTPPTLNQAFLQAALLAFMSMVGFLVLLFGLFYIFRFLQITFGVNSK